MENKLNIGDKVSFRRDIDTKNVRGVVRLVLNATVSVLTEDGHKILVFKDRCKKI